MAPRCNFTPTADTEKIKDGKSNVDTFFFLFFPVLWPVSEGAYILAFLCGACPSFLCLYEHM